jgi:hypothetical protein
LAFKKRRHPMKKLTIKNVSIIVFALLLSPALAYAQAAPAKTAPPPIAQELVREGDFALKLEAALGLEKSADEAGAETRFGELGITPRNGWIADYPVTPDILGELHKTVGDAAETGKIPLQKDEALKRFDTVAAEQSLAIRPHTMETASELLPEEAMDYPDPTVINNYYSDEGPPVVTYYAPPPDYYYLYSWVPFPFWCSEFWFPGFFVLHDFHRSVFFGHRVGFISNHFNDVRAHRVFRVDPVARFNGRTFAGIGVANRRGFISTGVARSERRIFNGPRTWGGPGGRTTGSFQRGGMTAAPAWRGGRSVNPSYGGGRSNAPSFHGERPTAPSFHGNRSAAPSMRSGGGAAPSSHGGGFQGRGERR